MVDRLYGPKRTVEVAIVGKYVSLTDAYLSVVEALRHASVEANSDLKLRWISSEDVERDGAERHLQGVAGVVVPGGFGTRGIDGKVRAIRYAREQKIPFLGLCLGMQCASIEWARHVAHLDNANSAEFDPNCDHPIIALLPEQEDVVDLGGTMRLGLYPCRIEEGTLAHRLYGKEVIYERHRHRYEFNNSYKSQLAETGYRLSGTSLDGRLVEIIEYPDHPFFLATQFHPEFQSRPSTPHPIFLGFLEAMLGEVGTDEADADAPGVLSSPDTATVESLIAAGEASPGPAPEEEQTLSAFADASDSHGELAGLSPEG